MSANHPSSQNALELMASEIEFHLDNLKISNQLDQKVRDHYEEWKRGHHDIKNAFVSLKQLSGKKSVHEYEAKIVLYHTPDNIVARHRSSAIPEALHGAIQAIERQLRETRSAFRDRRRKAEIQFKESQ